MKNPHPISIILLMLLFSVASPVISRATEAILTDNTTIDRDTPKTLDYTHPMLYVVANTKGIVDVSYIKFAFPNLPPETTGAQVVKATLNLYCDNITRPGMVDLVSATTSWIESTVNGTNAPGLGPVEVAATPITLADKRHWITASYSVNGSPQYCVTDGDYIWVSRKNSNLVTKYLASSGTASGSVSTGGSPSYMCFDGTYMWVAITGSNSLVKIEASNETIQPGTYSVQSPYGMCFDGANLWICSFSTNSVVEMNPGSGAILGTYPVGSNPVAVCFDGSSIWVANQGGNDVSQLTLSGSLVGTYPVQTAPAGIVFDGRYIWVSNSGANNISQLDYTNGQTIGTYPVGNSPMGVCFDGNAVWVADETSGSLLRR